LAAGGESKSRLVVGCGYLGIRVAAFWQQRGDRVFVTTRRTDRAEELSGRGLQAICLDVTDPTDLPALPPVDTLLLAVAYDPAAGQSRESVCLDGLQRILDAVHTLRGSAIYISTTGVYGQDDGSWVDEDSVCQPRREAGRIYLAAEKLLRAHRWGNRSVILRLAGIYGPGRVPYRNLLRSGEPLPVEVDRYLNLIHVDDAARAVLAMERIEPAELFLVSDGHPVQCGEYYREVARRMGTRIEFARPEATSARSERARTNKCVSNRKLLERLKLRLQYPSYREGLASALEADADPKCLG
jgi:nucleoside-diphosphate-sugar epimerase